MARYHARARAPSAGTIIADTLESVARTGAQRMLQRALEDEVQTFLGRDRYARGGRDTGYRNGHGRAREIGIGTWSVKVRPPRIRGPAAGRRAVQFGAPAGRRYLSQDTSACSPGCTSRASPRVTSSLRSASSSANGPPSPVRRSCASRPTGRPTTAPSRAGRSRPPSPTCGPTGSTWAPDSNPSRVACSSSSARARTGTRSCSG